MSIILALVSFGVAFSLAFLTESFTEYLLGTPMDHIPAAKPYKWLLMYASMFVGIGLCLFYKLDLIVLVAYTLSMMFGGVIIWQITTVGMVLSGVIIGRGANFLHDFLVKVLVKPPVPIG
jgi:hypothetical protein